MTADDQIRPGWRFHTGIILFALGLISPVFIPLVTATTLPTSWKTALSGLLMLHIPELLWVAAAAIMGKAGFKFIKGKFWGFFKKMAPPDEVGPARYRVGLVMFSLPVLFGWFGPYVAHWIPRYEDYHLTANLIGDGLLVTSLFVLGGDFWDKLRGLFIHNAKIKISARESKYDLATEPKTLMFFAPCLAARSITAPRFSLSNLSCAIKSTSGLSGRHPGSHPPNSNLR